MTGEPRLRVGLIGCGRIVQTVHASALASIPSISVTAVCDILPAARDAVGERLGVGERFERWEDLLALGDLDAVLVATHDHVDPALAAMNAGKHVLIEKPLCFDEDDGRRMVETAKESGVVAMLGYMKRYDWCLERARDLIARLPQFRIARMHDFACAFDKTDYLFPVVPPRGPGGAGQGYSALELLLMFASHDFSIIRATLGAIEDVVHVQGFGDRGLYAELRCAQERPCLLEISLDTRYEWFDETLTVFGEHEEIGIRFADPFVPHARSTLWHRHRDERAVREDTVTGPFDDGFRREWLHFADCIATARGPLTPLRHGLADIELARELAAGWLGAATAGRAG
jgi:predicted dehydrogenase